MASQSVRSLSGLPGEPCANCGTLRHSTYRPECGQKRFDHDDYALSHFVEHAIHDITHFDSKIFRSLLPVLLRPGFLTAEYLAGRRGRYIKPVTLFSLVNVVFFVLGIGAGLFRWGFESSYRTWPASLVSQQLVEAKQHAKGLDREAVAKLFNEKSRETKRYIFFASIPLSAVPMVLLFWRRRRYFVEHVIYSIHFHAFYLVFLLALFPVVLWLIVRFDHAAGTNLTRFAAQDPSWLLLGVIFAYHFLAMPCVRVRRGTLAGRATRPS